MTLPADKVVTAEEALRRVRSGDRVLLASGAAEPEALIAAMLAAWQRFADVEILHLLAGDVPHFVDRRYADHFRYNSFCVGDLVASSVAECAADYTPLHLSELPRLLRTGRFPLDVVMLSVTPPDDQGQVSLGVSVDVALAAVQAARVVLAEVNDQLPATRGNTRIPVSEIDAFIVHSHPLLEIPAPVPPPRARLIGAHVARLIQDGDVLHVNRDPISYAVLPCLEGKRDLGLHTDVLTDPLMDLMRKGVVTNARKTEHAGHTVASLAMGSRELYRFIHENPAVELHPADVVYDRSRMGRYARMVAIHSAEVADVTGNVLLGTMGSPGYRGIGGDVDLLRGASASEDGFSVLVLPALRPDGSSGIVPSFPQVGGTTLNRASVHYVCTEHGFAHLYAKTLRERVLAMIAIAEPRHRPWLMEQSKAVGYVPADQMVVPAPGCVYPTEMVEEHTFKGGVQVFFRPVHPSDERRLQRFFYTLSPQSRRFRYHGTIRTMPHAKVQQLSNIDYRRDVALLGLVGERGRRQVVCVGRYMYYGECRAEVDIILDDGLQGLGIGRFLLDKVTQIARVRGIRLLTADILRENGPALALWRRAWPGAQTFAEDGVITFQLHLPGGEVPCLPERSL